MQRALFLMPFVCVLAGFLVLLASWYLVAAKLRVRLFIEGQGSFSPPPPISEGQQRCHAGFTIFMQLMLA